MPYPYTPPAEIDGTPEEVRMAAVEQLQAVLSETEAMARNAYLSRVLEEGTSLTGIALAALWDDSDERAAYLRLAVLVRQLAEL